MLDFAQQRCGSLAGSAGFLLDKTFELRLLGGGKTGTGVASSTPKVHELAEPPLLSRCEKPIRAKVLDHDQRAHLVFRELGGEGVQGFSCGLALRLFASCEGMIGDVMIGEGGEGLFAADKPRRLAVAQPLGDFRQRQAQLA